MSGLAPDKYGQLVAALADRLTSVPAAELWGDPGDDVAHIDAAARGISAVFRNAPHEVPYLVAAMASMSPKVRPGDLRAACAIAGHEYQLDTGCSSPLLAPNCHQWLTEACERHGADPALVSAFLAFDLGPGGALTRPDGYPVPAFLRRLAGECSAAEVLAALDVSEQAVRYAESFVRDTEELLELVGPAMQSGSTLLDALDSLKGSDRVRAEELAAAMPTVLTLEARP